MTLVDPDPTACAVARRNFASYGDAVRVVTATGQDALAENRAPLDLVVIDAELPRTDPDPELRGKGVYRALLAAALPHLAPGAHVVAHNILLADATGDAALAEVAARNAGELVRSWPWPRASSTASWNWEHRRGRRRGARAMTAPAYRSPFTTWIDKAAVRSMPMAHWISAGSGNGFRPTSGASRRTPR